MKRINMCICKLLCINCVCSKEVRTDVELKKQNHIAFT